VAHQDEMDEILLDHAHCEKKAASTALSLIFRYPHLQEIVRPLSELAREELRHFELCLELLAERGVAFRRIRPSPYAGRLRKACRPREPERLLDTLLCCSLIEARSCERMKLLAEVLPEKLATFYRGLLASEARHHTLYVGLARQYFDAEEVEKRLGELAQHEAEILIEPSEGVRLHAG
jgi:tRNA-(ms[2]io[6]A)-hydroxylase